MRIRGIIKPYFIDIAMMIQENTWGKTENIHQLQVLKNIVAQDKLFHAYLFIGPSKSTLSEISKLFIKAALSEKNGEIDETHVSVKKIESGNSDEVIFFDQKKVTIKEIRELKERLSKRVYTKLFVVFNSYEGILPQAEQAMLKLLEEPIENVHFILLAQSRKNILDTVLSRASVMTFGSESSTQLSATFEENEQLFLEMTKLHLDDRFIQAEKITKDKEKNIDELLAHWVEVLHRELHAKIKGENRYEPLKKYSEKHVSKLILNFSAARSLVKKNVHKRLILENVCLNF